MFEVLANHPRKQLPALFTLKTTPKSNVALQGSAVRDITKKDKDILVQLRLET